MQSKTRSKNKPRFAKQNEVQKQTKICRAKQGQKQTKFCKAKRGQKQTKICKAKRGPKTNPQNKLHSQNISMSRHTFFINTTATSGSCIELSRDQKHHLFKVFRAVPGDEVELLDGIGTRAFGVIDENKNIKIAQVINETRSGAELHLVFALPRKNQLDLLLKQSAELGVTELHPVRFERSVSQGDCNDRWTTLLEEACKQSKNPFLPQVNPVCSLKEKLEELKSRDIPAVFGAIRSETEKIEFSNRAAWVVGPEGGFTDAEEELMRSYNAVPLNLGPWVLRLETAACAGIAVLRQILGIFLLAILLCGCSPNALKDPFFKKAARAQNSGNYASALSLYRRALHRHPQEPAIYLRLANLCDESLDDPLSALYYYNGYLKLVPENASDTESIRKLRDLTEQRLLRRMMKKYPVPVSPELEKLRRENTYLLKMNRQLGKLLQAQQQTAKKLPETAEKRQSKTVKKQKKSAKK